MGFIEESTPISGRMGRAIASIDGNIEDLCYLINIEATIEKLKKDVPILGRLNVGSKAAGLKYTGKMTIYKVTSKFIEIMHKYSKTGVDTYFDILIENDDPTSTAGKQSILLKGVNINSISLTKLDIKSEDPIEETVDFTFSDWDILSKFNDI